MIKLLRFTSIIILAISFLENGHAQETATSNFYEQIKKHDLSKVFMAKSFLAEDREGSKDKIERAEILGFIGNDYRRLFIHFISATRNPNNPNEYLVKGKTKVRENICSFEGKITVKQARIYKKGDFPTYQQGYADCDVVLYEDKKKAATGIFKGKLRSGFLIDDKGEFRYDGIMFVADGFSNNQFVGTWTSYRTKVAKKCNWGDYRIPNSGDLDIGAGEFSVNEKYVKNGWLSYMLERRAPNEGLESNNNKVVKWWEQ